MSLRRRVASLTGRQIRDLTPLVAVRSTAAVVLVAAAAATAACGTAPPTSGHGTAAPTPARYRVLRVVDGDTLHVAIHGRDTTLRLIGLDTPETKDPRKPVQCYGPAASKQAHKLLDGQQIRLSYDPSQGRTDRYGRSLAYVWLPDGRLYQQWMIRRGYGREYTYDTAYRYQARFQAAQRYARTHELGLWSPKICAGRHASHSAFVCTFRRGHSFTVWDASADRSSNRPGVGG